MEILRSKPQSGKKIMSFTSNRWEVQLKALSIKKIVPDYIEPSKIEGDKLKTFKNFPENCTKLQRPT